jgi:hypothetical protein
MRRALEAGDLKLLGDGVGVGHRERTGAAADVLGLLRLLEVLLRHLLGSMEPFVVELAPPDDGDQPAAGTERAGDVAKRLDGVGEEHHPHPGEGVVVGASQVADLDVGREEVDVLDPRLLGLGDRGLDERLGDVHTGGVALPADQGGQLLRGVTEAAADVEDAVSRRGGTELHRRIPVGLQARDDQIPEFDEAVEEHPAPGLGRLLVLGVDGRHGLIVSPHSRLLHAAMVRPSALLLHIRA